MYAVIEMGSKQYQVSEGDIIEVELLGKQPEEKVEIDKVLLLSREDKIEIGTPYVAKAQVIAQVIEDGKESKKLVFKFKNKTGYHRKRGHRQPFTRIQIEEIQQGA